MGFEDDKLKDMIQKTRKQLFGMQKSIKETKSNIAVMSTNEAPALAIDKCIELCNYFLGAVQKFEIPFDDQDEDDNAEEDDDERSEEKEEEEEE